MRFRIHVSEGGCDWWEDYDKPGVDSLDTAKRWAQDTIESFNDSASPGDRPRILLGVEIVGVGNVHEWIKLTCGMSQLRGNDVVDLMRCQNCGITGKRFGLSAVVKRDSKYRAKKYEKCNSQNSDKA